MVETIHMSFYRSSTICNKALAIALSQECISASEALPWVTEIFISSMHIEFMDSSRKLLDSVLCAAIECVAVRFMRLSGRVT